MHFKRSKKETNSKVMQKHKPAKSFVLEAVQHEINMLL
jgi:hypothetical protein